MKSPNIRSPSAQLSPPNNFDDVYFQIEKNDQIIEDQKKIMKSSDDELDKMKREYVDMSRHLNDFQTINHGSEEDLDNMKKRIDWKINKVNRRRHRNAKQAQTLGKLIGDQEIQTIDRESMDSFSLNYTQDDGRVDDHSGVNGRLQMITKKEKRRVSNDDITFQNQLQ